MHADGETLVGGHMMAEEGVLEVTSEDRTDRTGYPKMKCRSQLHVGFTDSSHSHVHILFSL